MKAASLRPAERLFLIYFAYSLIAAVLLSGSPGSSAVVAVGVAVLIWTLRSRCGIAAHRLRDWIPLSLILVAYWQVDFIRPTGSPALFARRWLPLDAALLRGLPAGGSGWSTTVSWTLETAYAATYLMPPLAVATLYLAGRRNRLDRFYAIFLGGTLLAYALLPFFPSASPRVIEPFGWMPPLTLPRQFNIWLLDHADIQASVFPSGHVAAAASAALGMSATLPEKPWIGRAFAILATLITVATVYGRYHYAVDAAASVALTVVVWTTAKRLEGGDHHDFA